MRAEVKQAEALAQEPAPGARPMKPEALAHHFRTMIEKIQQEALDPQRGPIGATLRAVDLEVRGLIVVEGEEPHILTPTPDKPVDPGQLSTVRMSFASAPVLRAQTEGER